MKYKLSKITLGVISASMLNMAAPVYAQENQAEEDLEVIQVTGIRSSLTSALAAKRDAPNLVEVIDAIDIGKLPDQNLAEVLENITGIQITRTAGIGTGVQIRGSSANRVEINGVSTVGAGSGRNGISFEDVNASIISGVEVIKASEAKTIEGSVGGTVNLKTIRPLELTETLATVRLQGEDSSLSTESVKPRFSGAYGDNWETDAGKFGFVISGSYTEQEAVSFRPRTDRDNLVTIGDDTFQGIQFLVQEQENDDYETTNISATFEWAPNDNLKFFLDTILIEQERSRDQYRLQASGISNLRSISTPSAFETINYGHGIGSFQAALIGELNPVSDGSVNPSDGNLRFTSETGSRITDTEVFVLGGEWQGDNLKVSAEISTARSDTVTPTLNSTLNFINPNSWLAAEVKDADDDRLDRVALVDGITSLEEAVASIAGGDLDNSFIYNDNATPFRYDLSGNSLSFGINFDSPLAPTAAQLTDPNNVVLDQVDVSRNTTENQEDAIRVDFEYFLDSVDFISSVDFGLRFNRSSHEFSDIDGRIGGFSEMVDSPNGSTFADILVTGPTNFDSADGRDLFIENFLLVDPDLAFSDPQRVIDTLQAAVIAHDPSSPSILDVSSDALSFRDIEEETTALYVQANFEFGDMVSGSLGFRYIDTDIDSTGFINGELETTSGSYDFILPRLNLVITPHDDVVVRLGYGSDIRRPNFDQLATGFSLDTSENAAVNLGNPGLEPEEVDSFDISAEWYFAEAAVASIGYFRKERTNIFGQDFEGALVIPDGAGFLRETDPTCPGGGFFNPIVQPNVLGDPNQLGLCVDKSTPGNDPDTTTQTGIEFAFQYDLSSFEDDLGWASGFGVVANYTIQDFSGGSVVDTTSGRGLTVLGDVSIERGLLDFSENAYNFTLYYEKFGLSARLRYTWREAFRTQDFGGGANNSGSSTLSFPVVTADRGQLNASVNYDVTDKLNIGLEAVNLTEEGIEQHCVSEGALLCFVGLPDRRVTFGATYKF